MEQQPEFHHSCLEKTVFSCAEHYMHYNTLTYYRALRVYRTLNLRTFTTTTALATARAAMASSSQTATATGSCLCQSVQYTLTGVDKGAVLCHCDNCQRVTGSAFAHNYRFLKSNIAFQKGEELVKSYLDSNTKSGNPLKRHFCSNCVSADSLIVLRVLVGLMPMI